MCVIRTMKKLSIRILFEYSLVNLYPLANQNGQGAQNPNRGGVCRSAEHSQGNTNPTFLLFGHPLGYAMHDYSVV